MPPQLCPTSTTGPSMSETIRLVAAKSSASDESGSWAAMTRRPFACRRGITLLQLDPSAHAPCTNTIVAPDSPMISFLFFPRDSSGNLLDDASASGLYEGKKVGIDRGRFRG